MSTRSNIGMVSKDGKSAQVIYCHSDGYPSYNGKILLEHYQDEKKIKQLIKLGTFLTLDPRSGRNTTSTNPTLFGAEHTEGTGERRKLKPGSISSPIC